MDMTWIIKNYEDVELEKKAVQDTIEWCLNHSNSQQVVQDAIHSFRTTSVDEKNSIEAKAKTILIEVARTKHLSSEQKRGLIELLVHRSAKSYEVDYSYIFEKKAS